MRHVFLVGFMGSGKSTVGRMLAKRLSMPFVDLDDRVEAKAGMKISELFETQGEPVFRELESTELRVVVDEPPSVVACGGGVVLSDENRTVLTRSGCVLYLVVAPDVAMARIGGAQSRPLLAGRGGDAAAKLLDARRSVYESIADVVVDTSGLRPRGVADQARSALEQCGRFSDG